MKRLPAALICLLVLRCPVWAQHQQDKLTRRNGQETITVQKPESAPATSTLETQALPLSADEAVRIGIANNPQMTAARAGVSSASANYHSLAAFPNPQFGVSRVEGSSTAPTLTGSNHDVIMDVAETLDTSGQRRYQAKGAKAQWLSVQYQLDETSLSLAQQIRDAYWSLVAARAQTEIAQENLKDVQRVHDLSILQQKAGASPLADVVRSSVDVANAEQASVTAQAAEQTALSALNLLLSRPPYSPVTPADNLATTTSVPTPIVPEPSLPEMTREALENRPLLKSVREQVRVALYARKQAAAPRRPDLTVSYQRSADQPVDSTMLGVQFPLFDLGTIRNAVRSAEETQKQAKAQLAQAEQQVTQQAAQAYADYERTQKLAASYQSDILAPSEKLLEMAQLGYTQGASGILVVIDAETTLRSARTGYINSLLALHNATDELIAATGRLSGASAPPVGQSATSTTVGMDGTTAAR